MDRQGTLQSLGSESFDLLVIGGGITGAGVAREAALRGLRVAPVEERDFAFGTSSRSTKLIHGGVRYLKNGELRLVRESVAERQHLLRMAPHLVKATPFLFPVWQGDPDSLFMLNIGLTLYDWFAGSTNPIPHRMHSAAQVHDLEPGLRTAGLQGGAVYADSRTDDGRLTLEVMQSAIAYGAVAANYVRVTQFLKDGAGRISGALATDQLTGDNLEICAARVLAAAGPWADAVRRLDDPAAPTILRLTKGIHLTVPFERLPLQHAVVIRGRDGRMMFAVPSQGSASTYLGTTDTDDPGDPAHLTIDRTDVDYVLDAARRAFPDAGIDEADVLGAWVGVRPLLKRLDSKNPSATSRDYALFHSASGLVSVGGGKLTAFRAMASHIVDDLFPATRRGDHKARSLAPLPGAAQPSLTATAIDDLAAATGADRQLVARLADRYGAAMRQVAVELPAAATPTAPAAADVAAAEPTQDPAQLWIAAQVRHAVKHEMALRLDDVLRRRTGLLLFTRGNGREHLGLIADEMGALLDWSPARRAEEIRRGEAEIAAMFAWRQ